MSAQLSAVERTLYGNTKNSRQRRPRAQTHSAKERPSGARGKPTSLRQPPPAAPATNGFGSSRSARPAALTSLRFVVSLSGLRCFGLSIVLHLRLPACHPLQHAVRVLDRVHMPIVTFDHLHRSPRLLRQKVHVHTFLQPQRGIGVPEAIGRADLSMLCSRLLREQILSLPISRKG